MKTAMTLHKATWLTGVAALVAVAGDSVAAPLALQDVPLFVAQGAEPNVMIMLDNSGSMSNIVPDAPYDPSVDYLSNCPTPNRAPTGTRIDLAINGSGSSSSPRIRISGTSYVWGTTSGQRCFVSGTDYLAMLNTAGGGFLPAQYKGNYLNWYFNAAQTVPGCATTWLAGGRKPCTKTRMEIAKTAGVNLVNSMPVAMRTGLSTYDNGDGGKLLDAVGNLTATKRAALSTAITAMTPSGNTPLAETLADIGFYFSRGATTNLILHPGAATPTSASRANVFATSYSRDSSWGSLGSDPIQFACQKNFAVLLTDGRPQGDRDVSTYLQDYDGDCAAAPATCVAAPTYDRKLSRQYESEGSDYLDDVAQALFEVDLRPGGPKNNVATYLISFADDQAINDPLMQDAADQGGGEKFIAGNEAELTAAFAAALGSIVQKTASASSASVNSGSISSDTRVYQAKFNSATWTGQLLSFPVNADGSLVTNPSDTRVWDASDELPLPNDRHIVTVNNDGTAVPFRWTATAVDGIDATRKDQLGAATDAVVAEALLNYLRGDAANEGTAPASFRTRTDAQGGNKLGDIVSSAPLFVGRPPFRYSDSLESARYSDFVTTHTNRRGMVYAGSNDGMLHGFDANNGTEVFAFIPSAVFGRLPRLAQKTYAHEFFVDGSPSMGDVFFGGAWHTVLVGGLNKGGAEIYALDVTDPTTLADAESNASSVVLWEFTTARDADLGLTYSQPAIGKMQNGTWAAVFGNGYNSTNGKAVLYIVDISNGSIIRKLEPTAAAVPTPAGVTWSNGLSTPALVDVNGDRKVDYAYAGDLFGNMWKYDLSSTTSSAWSVSKLFQAFDAASSGNAQPITVRPEVGRGPRGSGTIVLFGTGKYLELTDKDIAPQRTQTFYGIIDRGSTVGSRSNLLAQQITQQFAVDPDAGGPLSSINVRVTSANAFTTQSGWYLDLIAPTPTGYQGEKQVTNPIIRDGKVVFTTLIPNSDPCGAGGSSWLMELDMLSGSRLGQAPFDINNDGQFTAADMVTLPASAGGGQSQISGIQWGDAGILQSPGVIEGETGGGVCVQFKYMPDSAGNIQRVNENCGPGGLGRQSWRQIR